jgi:hypothetical protein
MGSNTGSFVLSCQRTTWLGGTSWPWCVAWYMRAMLVAGVKMPWRGAGAYAFLDWAKMVGRVVPIEHAQPGDALIWNIGSGHCSMLEKYDAARAQITDIGGNVDDSVARRVRPKSMLRGAIAIPPIGVPPAKPRHFEVVTSESGHAVLVVSGRPLKQLQKFLPKVLHNHLQVTIRRAKK